MALFAKLRFSCLLLLLLLDLHCSGSSESVVVENDERHFPFIQEASEVNENFQYDFIVIGGGAAGCALAATLSSRSKVLVLERGASPYGNPNITRKERFDFNLINPGGPGSPIQAFESTEGTKNFRARVLGGGTSVNAGVYSRASNMYIRNAGLDEELVEQSYEWVEAVVPSLLPPEAYQAVVRQALLESGVTPENGATYDHLVGTKTTGSIFDSSGLRHPSSDLFVYAGPKNLDVFIHATVHRVLFQGDKAYGALYTDTLGVEHVVTLNDKVPSEIILCAGALGSPQLLLLSGIGPKEHLIEMGVAVVLDSPGVGLRMADNPQVHIRIPSPTPISPSSREQVVGITRNSNSFIEGGSRTIGVNAGDYVGAVVAEVSGPASHGHLELNSLDPDDNPTVTFNYFKDPRDLESCVASVNTLEEMVLSQAFIRYRFENQSLPSSAASLKRRANASCHNVNASIERFCLEEYSTSFHYHGGCNVGSVIDKEHRVVGVAGLRVVDASTFDVSPGTNPQATVMMMGRFFGVQILEALSLHKTL